MLPLRTQKPDAVAKRRGMGLSQAPLIIVSAFLLVAAVGCTPRSAIEAARSRGAAAGREDGRNAGEADGYAVAAPTANEEAYRDTIIEVQVSNLSGNGMSSQSGPGNKALTIGRHRTKSVLSVVPSARNRRPCETARRIERCWTEPLFWTRLLQIRSGQANFSPTYPTLWLPKSASSFLPRSPLFSGPALSGRQAALAAGLPPFYLLPLLPVVSARRAPRTAPTRFDLMASPAAGS